MKPTDKTESSDSLQTTKTMRQKAKAFSRCLISMLKIWRLCFRKKRNKDA